MTLHEWQKEEQFRFVHFCDQWREWNSTDPTRFPLELDPEEWFEQYLIWSTNL